MTVHPIPGALARLASFGSSPNVEVDDTAVRLRAGLHVDIPRSSIVSATVGRARFVDGVGIHGWGGRWVVNGRMGYVAVLRVQPATQGHLYGVPVRIRELLVAVADPAALVRELSS
jgi:hypothetical protein